MVKIYLYRRVWLAVLRTISAFPRTQTLEANSEHSLINKVYISSRFKNPNAETQRAISWKFHMLPPREQHDAQFRHRTHRISQKQGLFQFWTIFPPIFPSNQNSTKTLKQQRRRPGREKDLQGRELGFQGFKGITNVQKGLRSGLSVFLLFPVFDFIPMASALVDAVGELGSKLRRSSQYHPNSLIIHLPLFTQTANGL